MQSKNIEPSRIQKTIPKKQNNPKSVFKTNIGVTNTVSSKVKEEKKQSALYKYDRLEESL
ncbi:hypothetical protein EGP98_04975 [bacterium]|nr:hypothetical protein [bacterium]